MKRIARFLICLSAVFALCSCAKTYKDIKVTSFDLVSVSPRGLTKVDALIDLGLDNPIVGFEVFDACGVVKLDGEPALTITADQLVISGHCTKVYRIPLQGEMAPGFNPLGLLSLAKEMDLSRFTADISAKVSLRGGVGKNIDMKDVPLGKLLDSQMISE